MGKKTPTRRLAVLGSLLAAMALLVACIGTSRAKSCSFTSECESSICNIRGFCESECRTNADCPCGAFCATTCGVCLRNDRRGPASCFAFRHGYDTNAVLGACLAGRSLEGSNGDATTEDDAAAVSASSPEAAASGTGPCQLVEPVCKESPPLDGAPDDAPGAEDGDAPEDEASADADADAAGDTDAGSEGGAP